MRQLQILAAVALLGLFQFSAFGEPTLRSAFAPFAGAYQGKLRFSGAIYQIRENPIRFAVSDRSASIGFSGPGTVGGLGAQSYLIGLQFRSHSRLVFFGDAGDPDFGEFYDGTWRVVRGGFIKFNASGHVDRFVKGQIRRIGNNVIISVTEYPVFQPSHVVKGVAVLTRVGD
jgi:hypothetical protein